ncbi:NUDIX hydrolase [Cryobacterium sp. BB307]|uniref:NUDIX hydrolase n=1 Tax=Cryobacterium sp. BB307 TaxID=2716317 RepID=UPI001445C8B2|nr:NUDIX hydrolase [Cryobacterium sp. BB307]
MSAYRDSHGKRLIDYWRPSVAVDTAVLTVRDGRLCVAVVEKDGARRLPGTFLHEGELLADAVRRSLDLKAGIRGLAPRQLHVFDAIDRDDRGRVLSIAHMVAVPDAVLADARLEPVSSVKDLKYDHDDILKLAVDRLRAEYREAPDPAGLLPDTFTLLDLRRLHEAVDPDGIPRRDTFRRLMEPKLAATGELERGTVGKPARLFRRR